MRVKKATKGPGSGLAPRERALAPELGEANAEIFGALGVTEEQLAALKERGVI